MLRMKSNQSKFSSKTFFDIFCFYVLKNETKFLQNFCKICPKSRQNLLTNGPINFYNYIRYRLSDIPQKDTKIKQKNEFQN